MKIALVTRRFPPLIGGAERVLGYLAPALAELGHEVRVLTSRLGVEGEPPYDRRPTQNGSFEVVRLGGGSIRMVGTWFYMQRLAAALRDWRPDVAYVSMLKHDAYVAVGVGQRLGFPVVLRPEGAGLTGDVAWQKWGRFGRTIGRRCREADALVAISEAVEGELRDWLREGSDNTKPPIVRLPNGVPVPAGAWQPRLGWERQPRAVYLGRLAPEKGLEMLVQAWKQVVSERPGARLDLVGEGPERGRLEQEVARLGLAGAVVLPGSTDDPTQTLRTADLFVLPSREEGMSIALLEAMGIGMPIVATGIPGNRKLLSDGEQGRLVPLGEESALAQAIVGLWNNMAAAAQMGRAARRLVSERYSIEAMARAHVALFEELRPRRPDR